jgi:nucleoid DNA-binding protein
MILCRKSYFYPEIKITNIDFEQQKMDIKLTSEIKELLIEDGSISIPNFGGFTSAYKPAVVDAMNGQLAPPSYHIAFDANLQMNDGRLVEHIRQKFRLTSSAALEYIEAFANEAHRNFEKGEIVVLPEIGRLYRDFAQKIQFLPDATNFNTDSFGLPSINFTPVLRNKIESINRATSPDTMPIPEASTPLVTTPTPPIEVPTPSVSAPIFERKEEKKPDVQVEKPQSEPAASAETPIMVESLAGRNSAAFPTPIDNVKPPTWSKSDEVMEKVRDNWRTWLPIAAVLMILGVLVWQLNDTSKAKNTEGSKKSAVVEPNVNISPLDNLAAQPPANTAPSTTGTTTAQVPDNQTDKTTITTPEVIVEPSSKGSTTNSNTNLNPSNGSKRATILIGGFGNQGNIRKLKSWISSQGYGLYQRKSGGLTMIGCVVGYESKADLQKIMAQLRDKYGDEIELIKK